MNKRTAVWWVSGLILALIIVTLTIRHLSLEQTKLRAYKAGLQARQSGQWLTALIHFDSVARLDKNYREVQTHLNELAYAGIESIPTSNIAAETIVLHRLASLQDWQTLAETLDRCRVTIAAGEFLIGSEHGSAHERPPRQIYLDAFTIDRYEVSNAQYQRFVQLSGTQAPPYWNGDSFPPGQADYPVVGVTWENATTYCAWAGGRLPTEAEWEKACRGTSGNIYPWGNIWEPNLANVALKHNKRTPQPPTYKEPGLVGRGDNWKPLQTTPASEYAAGLRPVGSYVEGASPYGVLDMAGNASEWAADWYTWAGYENLSDRNPIGSGPEWNRAIRGSSWYPYDIAGISQDQSRCAARNSAHRGYPDGRFGFRCVYPLP